MKGKNKVIFYIELFKTIRTIAKYLLYSGIAFLIYLSIKELAGKVTDVNFILGFISDICQPLLWVLYIFSVIWAIIEHKLRLKKVNQMSSRIKYLETKIDKNRSTSGILPTDETNPEDEHYG